MTGDPYGDTAREPSEDVRARVDAFVKWARTRHDEGATGVPVTPGSPWPWHSATGLPPDGATAAERLAAFKAALDRARAEATRSEVPPHPMPWRSLAEQRLLDHPPEDPVTTIVDRAVEHTATPDYTTGRVVYDVPKVGAFTIGYDVPQDGPDEPEPRLRVDYGRRVDTDAYGYNRGLPDEPVINRIRVTGTCVFSRDRLQSTPPGGIEWGGWIVARRPDPDGGYPRPLPDTTRNTVGLIVMRLAADFLARGDHDDLRAAWTRLWAPGRVTEYRRREQAAREQADAIIAEADEAAAVAEQWQEWT